MIDLKVKNKSPLLIPRICTGRRRNPGSCGTNQGSRQRRFAAHVRAGEVDCIVGRSNDQRNQLVSIQITEAF